MWCLPNSKTRKKFLSKGTHSSTRAIPFATCWCMGTVSTKKFNQSFLFLNSCGRLYSIHLYIPDELKKTDSWTPRKSFKNDSKLTPNEGKCDSLKQWPSQPVLQFLIQVPWNSASMKLCTHPSSMGWLKGSTNTWCKRPEDYFSRPSFLWIFVVKPF